MTKGTTKRIATMLVFSMILSSAIGFVDGDSNKASAKTNLVEDVDATATPSATPSATATATATATTGSGANVDLSQYAPTTPVVTARGGSSRVRLNWNKVDGADGYYIYGRTSDESVYTLYGTVTDGNAVEYTKTSLAQNATYYFRVSAYTTVNTVNVESDLSVAVLAKTASVSATSKKGKKYATLTKFKKSPAYKTYKKMKAAISTSRTFAIPGMINTNVGGFSCKKMVPQAMCLAGGYMLISAYDYSGVDYSVVYVVSKASKSYITTIVLPSKEKVGGMAYDGNNIWISNGNEVACFPYSVITDAVNKGSSYATLKAYTTSIGVKTKASYMGYYDGVLWVGAFSQNTSTMYGYSVTNKSTTPGLNQSRTMSVPSKTQGITFDSDGTLLLTRSYRTKKAKSGYISQVRTYNPSYQNVGANGTVLKNTALKVTTLPPMSEGMLVYGTYTYVLFSSSYYKSCKYPVDRVVALKTNKLKE